VHTCRERRATGDAGKIYRADGMFTVGSKLPTGVTEMSRSKPTRHSLVGHVVRCATELLTAAVSRSPQRHPDDCRPLTAHVGRLTVNCVRRPSNCARGMSNCRCHMSNCRHRPSNCNGLRSNCSSRPSNCIDLSGNCTRRPGNCGRHLRSCFALLLLDSPSVFRRTSWR
jgi:hypothetical protein